MLSDSLQEVLRRAFAEEAQRLILNFEEQLAALKEADSGSERREQLGNLRRTAHTLKGASRSVEFAEVESLSLVMEKKFKSLATESDEPFLSSESIDTIEKAVNFLDSTVTSLLDDADSVVPGSELMELMTKIEELALDNAPVGATASLPDAERDRVRFLVKMLGKTTNGDPTGTAFKKAFQILLSLNKIAKDNELNNILPLTDALESSFRTLSSGTGPKEWPAFALSLELLQKFGKNPAKFHTDLLNDAIAELQEEEGKDKDGSAQLSGAFLEETNSHLEELRSLLSQASIDGKFQKKPLKVCLMSLTGATRVVDLPTAETICRSLDFALTKYAEAGRAPAALLSRATEAVELLAQEVQAFSEGKPGLPSWKAMHIVERLDAAVDEIDTLGLEEKPAVAEEAPIPKAEPVSAKEEPAEKKSKPKKKAKKKEEPAPEPAPAPAAAPAPAPVVVTKVVQSQDKSWAKEALARTAPLENLVSHLTKKDIQLTELENTLKEWKESASNLVKVVDHAPDGDLKTAAQKFLQTHNQGLARLEAFVETGKSESGSRSGLLQESQKVRVRLAETFLSPAEELVSKLNSDCKAPKCDIKLELADKELKWDERYWDESKLKALITNTSRYLQVASGKDKISLAVKIETPGEERIRISFSGKDLKAGTIPGKAAQQLMADARSLYSTFHLPLKAGDALEAQLDIHRQLPSARAVFFQTGEKVYCLPTHCLWGIEAVKASELEGKALKRAGQEFKIHRSCPGSTERYALCLFAAGGEKVALVVDKIYGEQLLDSQTAEQSYQGYLKAESLDPEQALPSVAKAATEEPGLKVLLVQSFSANSTVLAKALKRAGHEVECTGEAQTALEMLEEAKSKFQVLVSDFHLPDMHGETLCETVKADSNLKDLRCYVLSDSAEEGSQSAAVESYFDKSQFKLDEFMTAVAG